MFVTKSAFEDLPESLKIHGSAVPIGFSVQGSVMAARFVTGNCPRKILAALAKAAARLLPDINTRIDQGLSPTDLTDYKKLKALAAAAVHILNANSALFSKSRPRTTIDILASWRIYAAQQQRVTGTIGWYDRGHFNFSGYRIGYEYHPAYYDTLDQFVMTSPAKDGKQQVKTHTMRREAVNAYGSIVEAARSFITPEILPARQHQLRLRADAA